MAPVFGMNFCEEIIASFPKILYGLIENEVIKGQTAK
jgi:hypothetical protein